jgi:putative flippase GtrA
MKLDSTLIRFVLVGLVNSAFTLVVFALLETVTGSHLIAAVLAVPICVLFAHATTGRLVFAVPGYGTLLPYVVVYGALGAINAAIIHVFVMGGFAPIWGQVFAFPVIGVLSYLASKNFVFRRSR